MIHALVFAILLTQTPAADPSLPPEAASQIQAGVDAENRRDIDAAIADFRKAAELAPSSSAAFLRLGDAYLRKRDYASATPALKRALELSPESFPAHQLLGFALLTEGYAAEAIPHLAFIKEYGALGIAELQAGQPGEAVKNLRIALEKNPDDPDLLYYLSRAATGLSAQSLDKLLATSQQSARAHQVAGQNNFALKKYQEAEKEYLGAIEQRPDLPGLRLELGEIYAAQSDWAKAEEQFRAEFAMQPGNAEAAYRLGDALLQQGKVKEAAEALRRSDALRPDMSETLYALGKSEAASDPAGAEKSFLRVVELERDSPLAARAYLALAGVHRKQGKAADAAKDMENYRRLEPAGNVPTEKSGASKP